MVHPLLALHLHPMCKEVILEFEACHKNNPVAKFAGACNAFRAKLDDCLTEEVWFCTVFYLKKLSQRRNNAA
jgi:hypothetical protein